jgi:hypothetical protein
VSGYSHFPPVESESARESMAFACPSLSFLTVPVRLPSRTAVSPGFVPSMPKTGGGVTVLSR